MPRFPLCPLVVDSLIFLLRSPQASSSPQGSRHIPHPLWLVTYRAESFPSRDNVSGLLEDSGLPGPSLDRLLQRTESSMFPLSHTTSKVFQRRKSYAQSLAFRNEEIGTSGAAELKKCCGQLCNCHHNKYPPQHPITITQLVVGESSSGVPGKN